MFFLFVLVSHFLKTIAENCRLLRFKLACCFDVKTVNGVLRPTYQNAALRKFIALVLEDLDQDLWFKITLDKDASFPLIHHHLNNLIWNRDRNPDPHFLKGRHPKKANDAYCYEARIMLRLADVVCCLLPIRCCNSGGRVLGIIHLLKLFDLLENVNYWWISNTKTMIAVYSKRVTDRCS